MQADRIVRHEQAPKLGSGMRLARRLTKSWPALLSALAVTSWPMWSATGAAAQGSPVAPSAHAQFFQGKTVRLLVGFGVGGGYDVYARMLAPHFSKRFSATFVVENMPGAGGATALNRLAASPPDGLTMMLISGNAAALAQLAGQSGIRYDMSELKYLATVSSSPWVWLTAPNVTLKSPQDAMALPNISWGASGPMDGPGDGAAFVCEALKLKCKIVLGYRSTAEVALAMARGEIDMQYVSDTSANSSVKAKNNKPFSIISRDKSRFFPDTPLIFDQLKLDADQTWLLDFRSTLESLGRILALPPGIPEDRLKFLQEQTRLVLTDPALLAEGERTERYVGYGDPATTSGRVLNIVRNLSAEQKDRVIKLLATVKE